MRGDGIMYFFFSKVKGNFTVHFIKNKALVQTANGC